MMDQSEATDFIIRQIDLGHGHEQIVQALCRRTGWPALHVERFVRQVAAGLPTRGTFAVKPEPAMHSSHRDVLLLDDALVEWVVRDLGRQRNRNDIIRVLCEETQLPWRQVERFVRRVEIEHYDRIAARQSPLVIFLGIGSIVGGLLLMGYTVYITLAGHTINLSGVPVPYLENGAYFVTGAAMVIGGLAGIWRAVMLMRR
jgi:hypothetical protein